MQPIGVRSLELAPNDLLHANLPNVTDIEFEPDPHIASKPKPTQD